MTQGGTARIRVVSFEPFRRSTFMRHRHSAGPSIRSRPVTILVRGKHMTGLKGLESMVSQLRAERTNLVDQLRHVDAALVVLGKLDGGRFYTRPRRLSASAREKIAAAQRARWARVRRQRKVVSIAQGGKRTMSASARRKIAAAQRKRWAKLKRQKRNRGNDRATRL